MIRFTATIEKFGQQGEKTGWTYISVPAALAQELQPGNKKGFRVKGRIDAYAYALLSLIPVGGGDFILTLNGAVRKAIKKQKGAVVSVVMEVDHHTIQPPAELMECLEDEPEAKSRFLQLPGSHRNYFTNWINSAKTDATKAKRIAATLDALAKGRNFGEMIRAMKDERP